MYDWQSPLAFHLGVNRTTVWRWATGRTKIPTSKAASIKEYVAIQGGGK